MLRRIAVKKQGQRKRPGVKKTRSQPWLSASVGCVTLVQAPALSEPPCAYLQHRTDGQRIRLRVSGRLLIQGNCLLTSVPDPMVSEAPPDLWATQQQKSGPEQDRPQLPPFSAPGPALCPDPHAYQQDVGNHRPVAGQEQLPKGQEHLWTQGVRRRLPGFQSPAPPRGVFPSVQGETSLHKGSPTETSWGG